MRTTSKERAEVISRLTQLGISYSDAEQLRPGLYRVRHTDASGSIEFSLSVRDYLGLRFVAGFQTGEKPPRKGKHLMLVDSVRNWIGHMELLP